MGFYEEAASDVAGLLEEFGAPVTFTQEIEDSFDEVEGVAAEGAPVTATPNGIYTEWSQYLRDDFGSEVELSDRLIMIDSSYEPNITDKVTADGETLEISAIRPIKPAGIAIGYRVAVR